MTYRRSAIWACDQRTGDQTSPVRPCSRARREQLTLTPRGRASCDNRPEHPATYLVLGLQFPIAAFGRLQYFSTFRVDYTDLKQPDGASSIKPFEMCAIRTGRRP